jgi:hypothetical protein
VAGDSAKVLVRGSTGLGASAHATTAKADAAIKKRDEILREIMCDPCANARLKMNARERGSRHPFSQLGWARKHLGQAAICQ